MSSGEKRALLGGKKSAYGTGSMSNGNAPLYPPPGYESSGSSGCWPCCKKRSDDYSAIASGVPDDHCHADRYSGMNKKATRQLLIATSLCFTFMITEAVGGYISNSIAVLTDAAHLCTDLFAFVVSIASLAVAARPPSKTMSFGWKRAEVIGALISVVLIWIITAILVDLAIDRLLNPDYQINAPVMVGTSAAGIIINIIMGCALNQDSVGKDEKVNINVRAAFIHVLGDLIQSIGVFSAALVIYMRVSACAVHPAAPSTYVLSGLDHRGSDLHLHLLRDRHLHHSGGAQGRGPGPVGRGTA